MITENDIKELRRVEPTREDPILTVYLNVDQSQATNLKHGFEVPVKNMLRDLENNLEAEDRKTAFREDAQRVRDFVADYAPKGKTLVLFADASRDLLETHTLEVPLENSAHWDAAPHLRPLAEARDEYERYGVILTSRAEARLFIVHMGEIEEHKNALAEADVHHFDASGKDKMRSQMSFQRKTDEHARQHLRNVASLMERLEREGHFNRLVLAGPDEALDELKKCLSEHLQQLTIGRLSISLHATEDEVVGKTMGLIQEHERNEEDKIVENLITMSAKNGKAAIGTESVLEACLQGRVRQLVYTHNNVVTGATLEQCARRIAEARQAAGKTPATSPENVLDWMVWSTLSHGGSVEVVKEEAAARLEANGDGVGALLW